MKPLLINSSIGCLLHFCSNTTPLLCFKHNLPRSSCLRCMNPLRHSPMYIMYTSLCTVAGINSSWAAPLSLLCKAAQTCVYPNDCIHLRLVLILHHLWPTSCKIFVTTKTIPFSACCILNRHWIHAYRCLSCSGEPSPYYCSMIYWRLLCTWKAYLDHL